jgi:hypothetical protein
MSKPTGWEGDLLPTASLRPVTLALVSSAVEGVSRQTVYRILDIDPRPTVSLTGELFKIDRVTIVCLCLSRRHCCFLRLRGQPERLAIFRSSLGGYRAVGLSKKTADIADKLSIG